VHGAHPRVMQFALLSLRPVVSMLVHLQAAIWALMPQRGKGSPASYVHEIRGGHRRGGSPRAPHVTGLQRAPPVAFPQEHDIACDRTC
jgi:hypothetical protein